MISAQQTYASANGGYFGNIVNLCSLGQGCTTVGIPNYPSKAPDFLGSDLARLGDKSGYTRIFELGVKVASPSKNVDQNSLLDYCYHAVPASPGLSGVRAFMGSGSGAIYMNTAGTAVSCPADANSVFLE